MGGCAGPELKYEMVNRRLAEPATVYLGGCMLLAIDLGGSDVCLELKAQQTMCPVTVLKDLYALKAN